VSSDAAAQRRVSRGVLAVDVLASLNLIGTMGKYLGIAALFPAAVAIGYGETFWPYLLAGAVASGGAYGLERATAGAAGHVGVREGFLVVSATWLLAPAFAALPYLFIGGDQLGHPIDAYFEGMSGFTTTGASVISDFDEMSQSLLMWRQFTQWLGGMGIVVLAIAVLPRLRVGGRQLLESELPGPEIAQLSERIRETAKTLWVLYVGMTATLVVTLAAFGWLGIDDTMTPYEAFANAFGTLPTGGFSPRADSAASFAVVTQWLFVFVMLIAGANYLLLYRAIARRQPGRLVRDEELRLYVAVVAIAGLAIAIQAWGYGIAEGEEAVRMGLFNAVSVITTTGLVTTDYAIWPAVMLLTVFALMFAGGSAGSTAGSIKIVRHLLVGKILRRELSQTVSPEVVLPIRLNGAPVDERTLRALAAFILLYVGAWAVGGGIIAIDSAISGVGLTPLDSLGASASAIGNVGPGFGITGPFGSFAPLGDVSKLTMIALMFLGRLEIIPVVVLVTRHYWRL
jgi:trk system potassium uptake protein TrkH